MNPNILPSDKAVLAAVIDPDAYSANTYTSGWVHMGTYESIQAIVMVGTMATNSTVDAKLEQATDSSGTSAKDISGKAITQLTEAGTDSDKQAIINCFANELDVANGFDYVRLSVTVATAASDMGGLVLGHDARYQPATDATTVDEVVS